MLRMTPLMLSSPATRLAILVSLFGAAACTEEREVTPLYNHANARIIIQMNQSLNGGEQVYTRARRGNFKTLDCAKLMTEIQPLEDTSGESIDGPVVDIALTKSVYDSPAWINPTPAMLASLTKGVDSIIDLCIMDGDKEVIKIERDLFQAWDQARGQGIGGKADDPSGEQRITSPQGYGERCVSELGEIPFFNKTGDGEYSTYNCLDSTPIPMTATAANGTVNAPQDGTLSQCDNPQYIYSLCEAGPRVATKINEQGTRWVLLCRKSIGGYASSEFNDIAMIGSNPFTGKTCFFQNALYSKRDGAHVPHPADKVKSSNLWAGVHGGLGEGIQCSGCHDADPFIHSPWIDGAKDSNGRPIVPKMGVDPDFAIGANDTPYALVNRRGQGWKMEKQITAEAANACTKCHRMSAGRWADDYLARMNGTDSSWIGITTAEGNKPENKYWMPPEHAMTDATWATSAEKKALEFIQSCGASSAPASCGLKDVPETLGSVDSGGKLRNPVTLADDELAKQATTLLGMNKNVTGNKICVDCHVGNTSTLQDWKDKTDEAVASGLKDADLQGEAHNDTTSGVRIETNQFKVLGPFEVGAGSFFEVNITGTGDVDLYVKRNAEVSKEVYDCRPFAQTSTEKCEKSMYNASGPAKFWIGLNGTADGTIKITAKYNSPNPNAIPAKDRIKEFRLDPSASDSPYVPGKVGIYAAAAHLGWFQDTFKQAFPAGEHGNTNDTWALEYGKFKSRSSMPKGNHPRLEQAQFDIVAEWFARGLPKMNNYIAPDTGPTSCTPSITSAVGSHVTDMATQGWASVNRQAGLAMFNVGNLPTAQSKSYGTGWAKQGQLRILKELTYNTYYWMRSSADGRFIANGRTGGDGAAIEDLQTGKIMNVKAAYDPGFFPDNKTWIFQGTPIGAGFCKMSLLQANPDRIDFSESACSSVESVSLYQHLGQGTNGGDYFVINSQFSSDNPGSAVNRDPSTGFASSSTMKLTPMVFDGTHYVGKTPVTTNAPYEGDSVLSPSTRLAISRFGNASGQLGYVLRKITTTPSGSSYTVSTQEIGRYCTQGAKPSFSFDEKYIVTHHYVGANDWQDLGFTSANDPTFKDMLAKGTSNIILVNIATGVRTRVTNMKPGQYALFPHFRSDGWFYFLVRDNSGSEKKEYAVASDAALTL